MHTQQHVSTDAVQEKAFACTPDQVGAARRWAATVYAEAGADSDMAETCRLLVSEVATNAVLHAGGEFFRVRIHRQDLRVEVWDSSSQLPRRRVVGAHSESGRGLELLDLLAPGFDVMCEASGKTVRFQPKSNL
ncbi:ATP-binding protein [Streptomyces anulatus]|uniref:ATP-binding protein n=1 Tax=Streptomyces anulatus TaxID=1892 RepID=UPI0036CEFDBE